MYFYKRIIIIAKGQKSHLLKREVKNMKTLKKAEQRNVKLNTSYYNEEQLNGIEQKEYTFRLKYDSERIRISLYYAKEIKVILDDYGYYANVVVMKDGSQYYINL